MARPLVIVAATGITVSVVCLSLASVLSLGRGVPFAFGDQRHSQSYPWGLYPWRSYLPFAESGDTVTQELSWDGADVLDIAIPGAVYFEPAPQWRVSVEGPQSALDHLRVEDGRIYFDAPTWTPHRSAVEVRISGPRLRAVSLNGSGKLVLQSLSQDSLRLDLLGSGSVEASGSISTLELAVFGSGSAELSGLMTRDLDVSIFGSGNADVSPSGNVQAAIFGSGNVRLHETPAGLSQKVMGSGQVVQLEAGRPRPAPIPR